MPQRVPHIANPLMRIGVPLLGLVVLGLLVVPMLYVRTPIGTGQYRPLPQPVAFDHNHHVARSGISCLFCHTDAERSASAGMPATDICMGCHRQVWHESPILAPVRKSFATGIPLAWQRVNSLPMFVFFNHSIHVGKGIDCSNCHGQVRDMPRVYQKKPLTMGWCLDCHRDPKRNIQPPSVFTVKSLTHCTACHR